MTQRRKVRIEQRVEMRCRPEKIFEVLMDPTQASHYAAGIEGAEILERGPDGGLAGSRIEMITRTGNVLMATVNRVDPPHSIELEDERGVRSTWSVEKEGDHCVLTNILEGSLTDQSARALEYDADVKFQALARSFELPQEDGPEGEGQSNITGTPRSPKSSG